MAARETYRFLLLGSLGAACLVALWLAFSAPGTRSESQLAVATSATSRTDSSDAALGAITARGDIASGPGSDVERSALDVSDGALGGANRAATAAMQLRVVDRATGQPIGGAAVTRVWANGDRMREGRIVGGLLVEGDWAGEPADDDGLLALRWSGSTEVDVRLEADGYVHGHVGALTAAPLSSDSAPLDGDEAEAPRRIGLVRAAMIVVEPTGFPKDVEGKLMLFEDGDARSRKPDQESRWRGETTITFEGVEPGRVSVVLAVRGHPIVARQSIPADPGEEVHVELRARRGEVLRGRIVEVTTRQPLAGIQVRAQVSLSGVSQDVGGAAMPVAVSGVDGSFVIEGLAPGRVRLQLTAPYGTSVTREVVVIEGEATRTRELAIAGAATLSGHVLVPDDAAPGSIQVAVMSTKEVASLRIEDFALKGLKSFARRGAVVQVGADGSYRFDAVASGRSLSVVASSPAGLGIVTVGTPLAVGEERRNVDVAITALERAAFRVVDSNTDAIESVQVSSRWMFGGRAVSTGLAKKEGPGGLYELSADAATVRQIELRAEGFLRFRGKWPSTDGVPDRQPVFTLTRSVTIEVIVQDTAGLAVRRARVYAVPEDAALPAGDGKRRKGRTRRAARTDDFGRATLTLEGGDRWVVWIRAEGYSPPAPQDADASSGSPASPLAFELEQILPPEPATVVGTLVRKGTGAPLPALRFDGLRNGSAEVDGASFRLVGLRPGRVKIVAHAAGFESVKIPIERLTAGEVRDVGEITTRGATRVDVVVRDENGTLVRDARVRLFRLPPKQGGRAGLPPRIDFPGRPDGNGRYRRAAVARVKWRLLVERKRSKRLSLIVSVTGAKQTVKVVLEPR